MRWEDGKRYALPQDHADMNGWKNWLPIWRKLTTASRLHNKLEMMESKDKAKLPPPCCFRPPGIRPGAYCSGQWRNRPPKATGIFCFFA